MFPPADLRITVNPVGSVAPAQATEALGDARQEAFQRSLHTLLGQSLKGEVLSKLADGSFLVKVAGTAARMMLPAGAQVGAEVPLTLVALSPRPTFQIGGAQPGAVPPALVYGEAGAALFPIPAGAGLPSAAAPRSQAGAGAIPLDAAVRTTSHAAALLAKAPIIAANQLPEIDPGSTPATFSNAARAISTILTTAQTSPGTPAAIIATVPLAPSPMVDPERMAGALRDAVASSGLFYESHVAQWAEGKRSLLDLMREPQMQRMQQFAAADGADLASAQLINLQLHTHEQARVQWQGEAWPGQAMQWEIHKDAPDGGRGDCADDEAAEPAWRSGVRFKFPLLGSVSATLVLVGEQVHIQIQTGTPEAALSLRAHGVELEQAMAAAGSPLSSLTISQEQDAPDDHRE